ncbi:MAG: hypothetical protein ACUVXF_09095, partial [Desulfobaccales bacterium]
SYLGLLYHITQSKGNNHNKDFNLIRASVLNNDALEFSYDIALDGGILKRSFIQLVKRFCNIPHEAVHEYGREIVA